MSRCHLSTPYAAVSSCTLQGGMMLALLLSLSACEQVRDRQPPHMAASQRPPVASVSSTSPSSNPSNTSTPPSEPATLLRADVLQKVCSATCGGPLSSIKVYRDADGKIARLYRLYGKCSHSPGIYFAANGTQLDLIPERPITPGSPEAQALEARHTRQTQGLILSDLVSCSDGRRSPPKVAK